MTNGTIRATTSYLWRDRGRALLGIALAVGAAAGATACAGLDGGTRPDDVSLVEWTSSFGFCPPSAYCTTRLRVTGAEAVVTLESRQSPTVTRRETLSAADADAIAVAAAEARFAGLGPVIGCPDCADGGAETLAVTADGTVSTVTFEYNASVAALEPLLTRTRALVERIRPAVR